MKKLLWLLMLVPCLLAVGCGKDEPAAATADTTTAPVTTVPTTETPKPETKPETKEEGPLPTSIELGKLRVQLLSDRLVRIEVRGTKGFEDRPSYTVQKRRNWEEVSYRWTTALHPF